MENPTDKNDERLLVERAQGGDRRALGAVLLMHGPRIYQFVLLPKLGVSSAKEVLSEVYVRTASTITRFVWQPSGLFPYMKTIAVRLVIDEFRRRKRSPLWPGENLEQTLADTQRAQDAAAQEELDAKRKHVEDAMNRIHPRYQEVLRLRILEDRSREEVAAQLHVSVGNLDVLLCRATKALKQQLETPTRGGTP